MRRRPPEISIEWTDVTIEIKVCSPELQPVERNFVKYVKHYEFLILLSFGSGITLSWIPLYFVLMTWMQKDQEKGKRQKDREQILRKEIQ